MNAQGEHRAAAVRTGNVADVEIEPIVPAPSTWHLADSCTHYRAEGQKSIDALLLIHRLARTHVTPERPTLAL